MARKLIRKSPASPARPRVKPSLVETTVPRKYRKLAQKVADGFTNINQLKAVKRNGKVVGYRSRINTKQYRKGQYVKAEHHKILLRKFRYSYYLRATPKSYGKSRKRVAENVYELRPNLPGKDYAVKSTLDTMEKNLRDDYGADSLNEAKRRLAAFQTAYKESVEEGKSGKDLPLFSEFTGS